MRFWERFHLRRGLNRLCKRLAHDHCLNLGGCCYCAALIAEHLEILGIKYKLVVADYETHVSEKDIYDRIEDANGCGGNTCSHYFLKIDCGCINTDDCTEEDYCLSYCNVDSNDIWWVYNTGSWNDDFEDFSIVKYEINKFFKSYEESK